MMVDERVVRGKKEVKRIDSCEPLEVFVDARAFISWGLRTEGILNLQEIEVLELPMQLWQRQSNLPNGCRLQ
jgi:hypothetical protein